MSDRAFIRLFLFLLVVGGFALGTATADGAWFWVVVFLVLDAAGLAIAWGPTITGRFSPERRD